MKRFIILSGFILVSLAAVFLLVRSDEQVRPTTEIAAPVTDESQVADSGPEDLGPVAISPGAIEPVQPRAQSQNEFWEEFAASTDVLQAGEFAFDLLWADFVDSLGLAETTRNQMKDILVLSEAHNAELSDLYGLGEISNEERSDAWITPNEVANALSALLPQEQVDAYLRAAERNAAAFMSGLAEFQASQLANGEVGILDAANRNDAASVKAFIDSGANPDMTSLGGDNTPLMQAVMHGNVDMAESLIDAGADVNLSAMDTTPLQLAAGVGNAPMVRLLIGGGAKPDADALWSASYGGYTDVVSELVMAGVDVSGYDGTRALEHAVENDDLEMERILIDAGAREDGSVEFARQARERELRQ